MTEPMRIEGRRLARNTVLNILGQVVPLAAAVAVIPFLKNGMGDDRFGILSIALVVLAYFTLFDFGVGRAAQRFMAEALGNGEDARLASILRSALLVQALLGIIAGALLALFSRPLVETVLRIPESLQDESVTAFLLLAAFVPLAMCSGVLSGALAAGQRFFWLNAIRVPSAVASIAIPAVMVAAGIVNLGTILFVLLIKTVVILILFAIACRAAYPVLRGKHSGSGNAVLRPLMSYGLWIFIHLIIASLLPMTDKFLIGSLVSMAAVTWYTIPYDLVSRVSVIPAGIVETVFPAFSAVGLGRREELLDLYGRAVKYTLLLTAPLTTLGLYLFGTEILTLWLGAEFAAITIVTYRWLIVANIIGTAAHIPVALLQAVGRPDIVTRTVVIELPLYVFGSWWAIGEFGIAGAAAAWAALAAVNGIIFFIAAHRLLAPDRGFYRRSGLFACGALVAVVAGLVAVAAPWSDGEILLKAGGALLLFAIASIIIRWGIFDDRDRRLGMRVLGSIRFRFRRLAYRVRNLLTGSAPVVFRVRDVAVRLRPWGTCVEGYWTGSYFERHELSWALDRLQDGMVCLDVGANVGTFTVPLAARRRNASLYAFEPCAETHQVLLDNLKLNGLTNVIPVRSALGDGVGEANLLVNAKGLDGLNTIGREATHSDARVVRTEAVALTTIDRFIEDRGIGRVGLIKVDVEGAELMVFRGAENLLRRPDAPTILFEYPGMTARGCGYDGKECLDFLRACGYSLWSMDDGSGTTTPLTDASTIARTVIAVKGGNPP